MKSNQPKSTKGGKRPGAGRPKGSRNKLTLALKEAILEAAERAGEEGGTVGYLERQAIENPAAFMTLLGKVLPLTLTGESESGAIVVQWLPPGD